MPTCAIYKTDAFCVTFVRREISATDARNRFGQLLDAAQSTPVRITRKGRAVAVMMSAQHYARLQGAAWEHLAATMDTLAAQAADNGLTPAALDVILSDES